MCCGRTRRISAGPRLSRPARGGTELTYVGRTALTVAGPSTGMVYRFTAPGARLRVDARDAVALGKIPVLRAAG
jgi:hypothetical protein